MMESILDRSPDYPLNGSQCPMAWSSFDPNTHLPLYAGRMET